MERFSVGIGDIHVRDSAPPASGSQLVTPPHDAGCPLSRLDQGSAGEAPKSDETEPPAVLLKGAPRAMPIAPPLLKTHGE